MTRSPQSFHHLFNRARAGHVGFAGLSGWGVLGDDPPPVDCASGSTPDINGNCCPIPQLNSDGTCASAGTGTANLYVAPDTSGGTAVATPGTSTPRVTVYQVQPAPVPSTGGNLLTTLFGGGAAKPAASTSFSSSPAFPFIVGGVALAVIIGAAVIVSK